MCSPMRFMLHLCNIKSFTVFNLKVDHVSFSTSTNMFLVLLGKSIVDDPTYDRRIVELALVQRVLDAIDTESELNLKYLDPVIANNLSEFHKFLSRLYESPIDDWNVTTRQFILDDLNKTLSFFKCVKATDAKVENNFLEITFDIKDDV